MKASWYSLIVYSVLFFSPQLFAQADFKFSSSLVNLCAAYKDGELQLNTSSDICKKKRQDKSISITDSKTMAYVGDAKKNLASIRTLDNGFLEFSEYQGSGDLKNDAGETGQIKSVIKNQVGISFAAYQCKTHYSEKKSKHEMSCSFVTRRACEILQPDAMRLAPASMDSRFCNMPNALDSTGEGLAKCKTILPRGLKSEELATQTPTNLLKIFNEAILLESKFSKIKPIESLDQSFGLMVGNDQSAFGHAIGFSSSEITLNSLTGKTQSTAKNTEADLSQIAQLTEQCAVLAKELQREIQIDYKQASKGESVRIDLGLNLVTEPQRTNYITPQNTKTPPTGEKVVAPTPKAPGKR